MVLNTQVLNAAKDTTTTAKTTTAVNNNNTNSYSYIFGSETKNKAQHTNKQTHRQRDSRGTMTKQKQNKKNYITQSARSNKEKKKMKRRMEIATIFANQ